MNKMKRFLKKDFKWLVLFCCMIGFIALTEDVFQGEIMNGDIIGYKFISSFISDSLTPVMKLITWFGSASCIILLTLILYLFIQNKKIGNTIIFNLVTITLLNQLLKFILQRPRPSEFRIVEASGYSFPSGHSMVSMGFYGLLIVLIYKYVQNKPIKYILISLLSILIVMIGISRIYLGVHYTSDVLAGFLVAISYLILTIYFNPTFYERKQ